LRATAIAARFLDATTAQLIGEFYWMTITRKFDPPGARTLTEWLTWSQGERDDRRSSSILLD
jgi:hypothetical protein